MVDSVYDVCVVGAGMIGSSAARHASLQGCKVCLIGPEEPKVKDITDSRDIYGSYYDEGRITRSTASLHVWATLAARSINRYRDLEKESGLSFYTEVGCLTVGQKGGQYITDTYSSSQASALDRIDRHTALEKFPYITVTTDEECIWESKCAGHINPRKLVAVQQLLARKYGCHVVHDVVACIENLEKDAIKKITTDNNRVFYTKKVLIATGTFTGFRNILPSQYQPDLTLKTQTVLLAEIHESDVSKLRDMPSFVWEETEADNHGCYTLPPIKYPDGKYYIKLGHGSMFEIVMSKPAEIKQWFCRPAPDYIKQGLTNTFTHVFPEIKPISIKMDTCVTTHSPTRMPYIDLLTPTLGVALAGNGYAAKSSDEIGKIAAELLLNGKWTYDLPHSDFKFKIRRKKKASLQSRL